MSVLERFGLQAPVPDFLAGETPEQARQRLKRQAMHHMDAGMALVGDRDLVEVICAGLAVCSDPAVLRLLCKEISQRADDLANHKTQGES